MDLSFVGVDDGWALGVAPCGSASCAALRHTLDDGRTWRPVPAPPAHVYVPGDPSCPDPCIAQIRFANDQIGYAFGSEVETQPTGDSAFFATTDGGRHWQREAGGADALETLDGNVIRVIDDGGCPPGCHFQVEIAPIGSTSWQTVPLPGAQGSGDGVQLARSGSHAYLQTYGNLAGGGPAIGVLWTSADDGRTWTNRGESCPQHGVGPHGEVDTAAMAVAPDGWLAILCLARFTSRTTLISSTDGGVHFSAPVPTDLGAAGVGPFAASSRSVLFVMADVLDRSVDGGRSWQRVQENSVGPLGATFLGFETPQAGWLIEPDENGARRAQVWTTRDGGITWRRVTIS